MNGYCDVATNGEVWTVIQRRQDAKTNFDLGWEDYSRGFGSPSGKSLHWQTRFCLPSNN